MKEHKIKGEKILFAAIWAVALAGTSANAAQLPSYEVAGFPISPHQIAVLRSTTNVKEQLPNVGASAQTTKLPQYEVQGFPITPHQMTVLGLSKGIRESLPHLRPLDIALS